MPTPEIQQLRLFSTGAVTDDVSEALRTDLDVLYRVPEALDTLRQVEADPVAAVVEFGPATVAWARRLLAEERQRFGAGARPQVPAGYVHRPQRPYRPSPRHAVKIGETLAALTARGISPGDYVCPAMKRELAAALGITVNGVHQRLKHLGQRQER